MEKIKHNHSLTDILKVCLFSLLMLAPLLASVSQILYVTLNKNAKDSYYGETINQETINYYTIETIEQNKTYIFDNLRTPNNETDIVYQFYAYVTDVELIHGDYDLTNVTSLQFYTRANSYTSIFLNKSVGNRIEITIGNDIAFQFHTTLLSGSNPIINNIEFFKTYSYNKYSYLDNAFYYGVDQMTKSDLFNWTQNTGIYTGVHAMTSGIGIESQFIPMLLTYWLVLTIVYIIIDVVIETFKYLTHMLQNKVKSKTS